MSIDFAVTFHSVAQFIFLPMRAPIHFRKSGVDTLEVFFFIPTGIFSHAERIFHVQDIKMILFVKTFIYRYISIPILPPLPLPLPHFLYQSFTSSPLPIPQQVQTHSTH